MEKKWKMKGELGLYNIRACRNCVMRLVGIFYYRLL